MFQGVGTEKAKRGSKESPTASPLYVNPFRKAGYVEMDCLHHKRISENGEQKRKTVYLFRCCKGKKVGLRNDGRWVIRLILALELHSHAKVSKIPPFQRWSNSEYAPWSFCDPLSGCDCWNYIRPPHLALTCALWFWKHLCNQPLTICDTVWRTRYGDKYQDSYLRSPQDRRENTHITHTYHTIENITIKVCTQVKSLRDTMRGAWPRIESR